MLDNERTDETGTADQPQHGPGPDAGSDTGQQAGEDTPPKATRKRASRPRKKAAAPAAASPDAGPTDAGPTDAGTTDAAAPALPGLDEVGDAGSPAPAKKSAAKRSGTRKSAAKKVTPEQTVPEQTVPEQAVDGESASESVAPEPVTGPAKRTTKKSTAKKAAKKSAATTSTSSDADSDSDQQAPVAEDGEPAPAKPRKRAAKKSTKKPVTEAMPGDEQAAGDDTDAATSQAPAVAGAPLFQAPEVGAEAGTVAASSGADADAAGPETAEPAGERSGSDPTETDGSGEDDDEGSSGGGRRRRRKRGGRRRRKGGGGEGDAGDSDDANETASTGGSGDAGQDGSQQAQGDQAAGGTQDASDGSPGTDGVTSKRRRRRRRAGDADTGGSDGDGQTVTKVRKGRSAEDEITAVSGSTRLEAKKQRRREGREAGRRRAPIVSEAEFLARRESVERTMLVRQRDDVTQIGVLEDGVLVEHYVARDSQTSLIGNVYIGRVQNVLPSMEAAFIDIGKGRNAVLYAGEVNWSALGHTEGQPRKIESVLSSGQSVLVQVTKDPIGHKGARLTSQISLAGRFLVYVPDGTTSGISRKLPDTERARLKALLKEIVPEGAGVIVRTAAEGATEEQLTQDVERLTARWDDIESKTKGGAPKLLYGEPDLTLKVVRDLFTEDFRELVVEGDGAWETVHGYVSHVAPDLQERLHRFEPGENGKDLFGVRRVDEQIAKGLDRKVWLPSGGSLIFDRTEAMTVVDVNTGKFTGSGGNLEETVTKNNLEAAEELVRQLRLRDLGGIIVVDFIDMVLESNRDLVLRRLVECLGRDRTRHQVAEVSSLGLVQMTRKRIGTGLLEAFSEQCDHCRGSGVHLHDEPVEPHGSSGGGDDSGRGGRRKRGGKGRSKGNGDGGESQGEGNGSSAGRAQQPPSSPVPTPSPSYVAAVSKAENADKPPLDEQPDTDGADRADGEDQPASSAPEQAVSAPEQPSPSEQSVPEPQQAAPEQAAPEQVAPEQVAPEQVGGTTTVTRTTRRRSAVRAAGSPEGATAAVVVAAEPTSASDPVTTSAPPPAVVTRTRGSRRTSPRAARGAADGSDQGPSDATGTSSDDG